MLSKLKVYISEKVIKEIFLKIDCWEWGYAEKNNTNNKFNSAYVIDSLTH